MKNLPNETIAAPTPREPSDEEMLQVIADFLAMGYADNIVAMFRQEPRYWDWAGRLLTDERYAVRLGVLVLFEQLVVLCPEKLPLAIPSLAAQLDNPVDWVRGEAVSVLGLIASDSALDLVRSQLVDRSPQVREIAHDILGLPFHG